MKNTRKGTIRFLYRAVVFMNRIEVVKGIAGKIIEATLPKDRQAACIHLYGVAQACALLALRRGQDVELAVTAGLLHDLLTYYTGYPSDQAHPGRPWPGNCSPLQGFSPPPSRLPYRRQNAFATCARSWGQACKGLSLVEPPYIGVKLHTFHIKCGFQEKIGKFFIRFCMSIQTGSQILKIERKVYRTVKNMHILFL